MNFEEKTLQAQNESKSWQTKFEDLSQAVSSTTEMMNNKNIEIQNLNDRIKDLQSEMVKQRDMLNGEMVQRKIEFLQQKQKDIEELCRQHEAEKGNMNKEHENEKLKMIENFNTEIRHLEDTFIDKDRQNQKVKKIK
jgi:predicted  nucleic acid-binding Zn-ribbon protein